MSLSRLCTFGCLLAAAPAAAQAVECSALPNPVYIQAGSTIIPTVRELARLLRDSTANPMTLVFISGRSCTMINEIATDVPLAATPTFVPSSIEDPAWTSSSAPLTCTLPAGQLTELVHADVFARDCSDVPLPADVKEFTGPVLPFVWIAPEASAQTAITAEEAYFVWGFGAAGGVQPWIDEAFLMTRPNTSGTKLTFGAHIGVPVARWLGVQHESSGDLRGAVAGSTNPDATIGILGGSDYDANRDTLKALAYKSRGQRFGYFPDKTSTSFEKQNVRDGHYTLWAPAVFLTKVAATGAPANARVAFLLDLFASRAVPGGDVDATGLMIDNGFVPQCAMSVERDGLAGDLRPFTPDAPCGCFFEDRVGAASACTGCVVDSDCGAGSCVLGFCEGGVQ